MAKQLKAVELFLTLGLAATLGACGSPSTESGEAGETRDSAQTTDVASDGGEGHGGEGHSSGEGGEGGEGSASGNPDVDYMTSLALMKGHLSVAEELINEGSYAEAEPHIGHPVEELYGGIESQLTERNVPQFKSELTKLHDLAKSAPTDPQLKAEFQTSTTSIDSAIAALPEEQRQSPEFVMDVIVNTLRTAAEEYEAAIADNQIVEVIEYQDSRGFVLYADQLYQTIANEMSQSRPDDHAVISQNLAELQTVWPSVTPPETPVQPPEAVYELVSEIESQR